jgi:hypothetical protein
MGYENNGKNSEVWTLEESEALFLKCLEVAKDKTRDDNDFIGEVALTCDTYLTQLDYLKKKYPELLNPIYNNIKSCCEANCFRNGKTQKIVPSMAIMNLKSNHGWTDRVEQNTTVKDERKGVSDLFPDEEEIGG